ncbi:MAG: AAA family ATPase [Gammaproteobacteria bacterium]
MSTIERAMRRLRGEPEPENESAAGAGDATVVATPDASAPSEGVPETAPVQANTPAPPAVEVEPPARPAAAVVSGLPPAAASSKNYLHIDLERLAARGFLVPTGVADRKSEEYQKIKRRILGNMVPGIMEADAPKNLVMVTSAVPGEGKTYTSANLAMSLAAELDRTVLAVDTDIVKSDLTRLFGAEQHLGLFDYLSDPSVRIEDVMLRTNIPKLTLIPSGRTQHMVTERLASEAMKNLTVELANRYRDRVVLFDCPPVLATTSAVALAPSVGQIIVVVEACKTTLETIKAALGMLENVRITGMILNKSRNQPLTSDYYGYGYGYGYYGKKKPS